MDIELWKILLGVFAFIAGQAVLQFILQPIKDFNKERGDTAFLLLLHLNKITNGHKNTEAAKEIREMGASLVSCMHQIPFYKQLAVLPLFGLPNRGNVIKAARELNEIGYSLDGSSPNRAIENVKGLSEISGYLRIPTFYT